MFNRSVYKSSHRKGAATVELAVCLPVLLIIVLGCLAATSMIFVRSAVVQSAYEAIKEAVREDGDLAVAQAQANAVLTFRNITPTSIVFDPADVANQVDGTPITVTVTANAQNNGIFSVGPLSNRTIAVSATMLKE